MRRVPDFRFPHEQVKDFARATRLAWITAFVTTISAVLFYLVKGRSMAMQAAWLESLAALVPPLIFLVTAQIFSRQPSARFPYGQHRAPAIGYLLSSLVLLGMGAYIIYSSAIPLMRTEYPAIGTVVLFGAPVWLGWLMLPVLVYDMIAMIVTGRLLLPYAKKVHDKQLYAIAKMNKADWLSDAAAILGVLGIGLGVWWMDAAAALVIGFDVFKDGITNTKAACTGLMDATPTEPDEMEADPVVQRAAAYLRDLDWVEDASLRMRDEGHVYFGEGFVVPRAGTEHLVERLEGARREIEAMDWKIQEMILSPVASIPRDLEVEDPPLARYEERRERRDARRQRLHKARRWLAAHRRRGDDGSRDRQPGADR